MLEGLGWPAPSVIDCDGEDDRARGDDRPAGDGAPCPRSGAPVRVRAYSFGRAVRSQILVVPAHGAFTSCMVKSASHDPCRPCTSASLDPRSAAVWDSTSASHPAKSLFSACPASIAATAFRVVSSTHPSLGSRLDGSGAQRCHIPCHTDVALQRQNAPLSGTS